VVAKIEGFSKGLSKLEVRSHVRFVVQRSFFDRLDEFSFESLRHMDYPFGLSLFVKGVIDSRISTCCEYKHRRGVRLGGELGHFAIKSVHGSKPCIK
jgi:hypothetical protein